MRYLQSSHNRGVRPIVSHRSEILLFHCSPWTLLLPLGSKVWGVCSFSAALLGEKNSFDLLVLRWDVNHEIYYSNELKVTVLFCLVYLFIAFTSILHSLRVVFALNIMTWRLSLVKIRLIIIIFFLIRPHGTIVSPACLKTIFQS